MIVQIPSPLASRIVTVVCDYIQSKSIVSTLDRHIKMKTLIGYLGLSALIGAILAIGFVLAFIEYNRLPSDVSVVSRFSEQKPYLIELKQMLSREPSSVIGITENKVMINNTNNWISPQEAKMAEEHFLQYQALMKKSRIKQIWRSDGAVFFNYAAAGFASFGWRLTFVYMQATPSPIVSSIDSPSPQSQSERSPVYRSLQDNWYVRLIH